MALRIMLRIMLRIRQLAEGHLATSRRSHASVGMENGVFRSYSRAVSSISPDGARRSTEGRRAGRAGCSPSAMPSARARDRRGRFGYLLKLRNTSRHSTRASLSLRYLVQLYEESNYTQEPNRKWSEQKNHDIKHDIEKTQGPVRITTAS